MQYRKDRLLTEEMVSSTSCKIIAVAITLSLGILAATASGQAQIPDSASLYIKCTFYPQAGVCDQVYQTAIAERDNPAAAAVRDEYDGYGRYLKSTSTALTPEDVEYLKDNAVDLPEELSPAQLSGLHNVLTDPALQNDAREKNAAINNFLNRAVEADLYCAFNDCGATGGSNTPVS
jgi:hypothetical protein